MFKSKILHKTMLLMTILISGYIGAILIHAFPKINDKVISLEKINVNDMLNSIVIISKMSYDNIEKFKQKEIKTFQLDLENTLLLPRYILKFFYDKYQSGKLSEKKAKNLFYSEINKQSFSKGTNFLIFDKKSRELISYTGDNNVTISNQIKSCIKEQYPENKNNFFIELENKKNINKFDKKMIYLSYFKPWDIYFGVEKSLNLSKEIRDRKKRLLKKINKIMNVSNFGKLGTSFIFDENGKVIIYQNLTMKDINLKSIKNPNNGKSLYDTFIEVAKTKKELKYFWNKPNDKNNYSYEKILWIKYIPKLKWYVATTVYTDEFEVMSHKLQKIVATLGLISLIIAVIISFVFFKKLLQPILTLSDMANSATNGDYSVRCKVESNDEIGQLSRNFNMMIETIEKNIKKEKKIMEQSRLAQMGEIMSMIAHQWRQPLGAISSAVINIKIKIQSKKYNFNDKKSTQMFLDLLDKKLNSISEYVQFLSTTVDDFRTFFKQDVSKEYVCLTVPLEKALQMIEISMVNKNIQIKKDFQTNDKILIYKNELIQVVLNILKNSEDNFIEKKISNPRINILTKKKNNEYIISITDNGGGIREDILSKIFKPYFSTKLEKNGTGLGLYMSKVIIEEHHNGVLKAKNLDNGVCFEIILYK